MARIKLCLMGSFRLLIDDQPVTNFDSNKVRALLAFLAVESSQPQARGKLADLFWPDQPEKIALSNLRGALANLRQLCQTNHDPTPVFLSTRDLIQLNPACDIWVDVAAFLAFAGDQRPGLASLERAMELYQGDFLSGFMLKNAPSFEEWVLIKREEISRDLQKTIAQLISAYEINGDFSKALNYARKQVELEPWNEEALQALMQLLALCGERSAALEQFRKFRARILQDLGLEPAPITYKLFEAIRSGILGSVTERTEFADDRMSEEPGFFARENELQLLEKLLIQTIEGQGGVVWISGDAGSGKTTLMSELVSKACQRNDQVVVAWGDCHAYTGLGIPFQPFAQILRQLIGDTRSFPPSKKSANLVTSRLISGSIFAIQALLEQGPHLFDRFIAEFGLPDPAERGKPGEANPMTQKERANPQSQNSIPKNIRQSDLFEEYVHSLLSFSRNKPVVILIDDIQRMDPDSIDLLVYLIHHISQSRILVVGAFRPEEIAAGRNGQPHPLETAFFEVKRRIRDVTIDLDRCDGTSFINAYLDSQPNSLGRTFRERLYRHTSGHPLFTIELVREMQQQGYLVRNQAGQWVEGENLSWNYLPRLAEAIIAERIDRLPPEMKYLLNVAAVEGEEFTAEVIAQVMGKAEQEIILQLSGELSRIHQLVGLLQVQSIGGQRRSRYRFRHGLFQDYLYGQLDDAERACLHQAVGERLESFLQERPESRAAILAYHFDAAGIYEKAIRYYQQAGDYALKLFANQDAIKAYRRAIVLIALMPQTSARIRQELLLYETLIVALRVSRGFGGAEVEQACDAALRLSRLAGEFPDRFMFLSGLKSYYDLRANLNKGREMGEELLRIAESQGDPARLAWAHSTLGATLLNLGDLDRFFAHSRQVEASYSFDYFQAQINRLGHDPLVANLSNKAWALWFQGYPDQAVKCSQKACELAGALNHPGMMGYAHFFASVLYYYLRDDEACRKEADYTITLTGEKGVELWLAAARHLRSRFMLRTKEGQEMVAVIKAQRESLRASGADLVYISSSPALLEDCLIAGEITGGLAEAEELLSAAEACGMTMIEPELYRLKGELFVLAGKAQEAEIEFNQAIQIARQQGMRSWELRATMSLFRLMKRQGNPSASLEELEEIYQWFTEGFQTIDLLEARALLQESPASHH